MFAFSRSRVLFSCRFFSLLHPRYPTAIAAELEDLQSRKGFIIDMDGVIYHGSKLLPGAKEFITWLKEKDKKFLFLTNSAERSPRELRDKLKRLGVDVDQGHFYTSALSTAAFLASQKPNGTCYVIGEPGLTAALYDAGYAMNDTNPDYVVVGETRNYNYEKIEQAVHLVLKGARLIGTNCDLRDRMHESFVPACGSLIKPIEMSTGREAFYCGKPNPLMMRAAIQKLGVQREDAMIIGDRMDTDILAGVQSGIATTLLLSGVTALEDLKLFGYQPHFVMPTIGHLLEPDHFMLGYSLCHNDVNKL